jgi:Fis family transcriptional regulator
VNAVPVPHVDPATDNPVADNFAAGNSAADNLLQPALRECVARAVRRYLTDLDSQMPDGLYDLVLREVETPLLREVLHWSGGNQSKAAIALGINRATLRKKLTACGLS